MNASSNRLGLSYSAVAVLFWGMLPIALKLSGGFIDAVSLTWLRFIFALVATFMMQYMLRQLGQFARLQKRDWLRLAGAGVFLIMNYVTFVMGLKYLSPGTAQLNFQVAPFFLAFGGLLFFRERISALQLTCFAALAAGMLMFFHPHLHFGGSDSSGLLAGVLIIQFSAFCWASYALLQKSLLAKLSPNNVMLCIFALGTVVMAPATDFSAFGRMSLPDWSIALFCAVNTLVAYGTFGQAMRYWPTAQVSAMVALTPVLSFSLTELAVDMGWWPEMIKGNSLDWLSISGIGMIVLAVMAMQLLPLYLSRRSRRAAQMAMKTA
ncbi:10 TMS drug/metabolite efflux pump (DME) family protein [Shewanella sp. NFH-SH190041]|uniref:DMT family transporter n=1 Tax=Shewanella sp. NFH-SH190041 TaxID=2950245 RepID=UPI0021C2C8C0|nr:DMT family transporter [Shewanella sp. NFH-SH190041]BDM63059.1 10 TMS drug/metabolite efflux pump (DME) family protein [Shewanella sp. NFH-SH190041]